MKHDTGIVDIHGKKRKIVVGNNGYEIVPNVGGRGGKTIYMHRYIAGEAIGRELKCGEVVHHIDGNRANNEANNLVVCQGTEYHHLIHVRQRAYAETGDATSVKCEYCGKYGADKKRPNRHSGWHFECKRTYERNSYARRKAND